jgi:hypothetical protein
MLFYTTRFLGQFSFAIQEKSQGKRKQNHKASVQNVPSDIAQKKKKSDRQENQTGIGNTTLHSNLAKDRRKAKRQQKRKNGKNIAERQQNQQEARGKLVQNVHNDPTQSSRKAERQQNRQDARKASRKSARRSLLQNRHKILSTEFS